MTNSDLDCVVYADATSDALSQVLGAFLTTSRRARTTARAGANDADIVRNTDHDDEAKKNFPGGFLHFLSRVELYPDEPTPAPAEQTELVSALLEALWSSGIPAVAVSDYGDLVVRDGGFKQADLPWPGQHHR